MAKVYEMTITGVTPSGEHIEERVTAGSPSEGLHGVVKRYGRLGGSVVVQVHGEVKEGK